MFLESKIDDFYESRSLHALFSKLDLYWNYLNYDLLDHLIKNFKVSDVEAEMERFKSDLRKFRLMAPLNLFCNTQKKRHHEIPAGFKEMVAKFKWPKHVTLDVVERFREEFACGYRLRECAMMVVSILPGSFSITFHIPEFVVGRLSSVSELPKELLIKYNVQSLMVDGNKVFEIQEVKCLFINHNNYCVISESSVVCLSAFFSERGQFC